MVDPQKPTKAEKNRLLAQIDQLVLAQTNVFIRELLRGLGYKPGANKSQFRASLESAIDEGKLTKKSLDDWLRGVEGWGNQHVYAFGVPGVIAGDPVWKSEAAVNEAVEATFPGRWGAPIPKKYPELPKVARTGFESDRKLLLVEWHERANAWTRAPDEDERRKQDGDDYWWQAYRLDPSRALMRFALLLEPEVASRPIAALFVRVAVGRKEHRTALETAWTDLEKLVFGGMGLGAVRGSPWDISTLIKTLDDDIVHDNRPEFRSRGARFSEGLASVEFVAPPDLTLPDTIREVRLAIPQKAIDDPAFMGNKGDFQMVKDPARATSREAHVQLFQKDDRIRIWTELDEPDVWLILETLDGMH